jgi:hypothetical protein
MGALRKYDPKEVTLTWGDLSLNEGIVDGSFIVVERAERNSELNMGADGDGTAVIMNDRSGTVTLTLRAGSNTNSKLQAVLETDEADSANKKFDQLTVKDFTGESEAGCDEAFLDGPPTMEFATEEGERVWTFQCHRLDMKPKASNRANPTAGGVGIT